MSNKFCFICCAFVLLCLACSNKNVVNDAKLSAKCYLEHDPGPCRMAIDRYYYDESEKKCKKFIYGGCKGEAPFETLKECQVTCGCLPVESK